MRKYILLYCGTFSAQCCEFHIKSQGTRLCPDFILMGVRVPEQGSRRDVPLFRGTDQKALQDVMLFLTQRLAEGSPCVYLPDAFCKNCLRNIINKVLKINIFKTTLECMKHSDNYVKVDADYYTTASAS